MNPSEQSTLQELLHGLGPSPQWLQQLGLSAAVSAAPLRDPTPVTSLPMPDVSAVAPMTDALSHQLLSGTTSLLQIMAAQGKSSTNEDNGTMQGAGAGYSLHQQPESMIGRQLGAETIHSVAHQSDIAPPGLDHSANHPAMPLVREHEQAQMTHPRPRSDLQNINGQSMGEPQPLDKQHMPSQQTLQQPSQQQSQMQLPQKVAGNAHVHAPFQPCSATTPPEDCLQNHLDTPCDPCELENLIPAAWPEGAPHGARPDLPPALFHDSSHQTRDLSTLVPKAADNFRVQDGRGSMSPVMVDHSSVISPEASEHAMHEAPAMHGPPLGPLKGATHQAAGLCCENGRAEYGKPPHTEDILHQTSHDKPAVHVQQKGGSPNTGRMLASAHADDPDGGPIDEGNLHGAGQSAADCDRIWVAPLPIAGGHHSLPERSLSPKAARSGDTEMMYAPTVIQASPAVSGRHSVCGPRISHHEVGSCALHIWLIPSIKTHANRLEVESCARRIYQILFTKIHAYRQNFVE